MKTTDFRFVFWNIWGSRHTNYVSWISRRAKVAKRMAHVLDEYRTKARASVYSLVECTASEASYLAKQMGKNYTYIASPRYSAIVHHKDWKRGRHWVWKIDSAHDILCVELTRAGVRMNFVAMHLPPDLAGKDRTAARKEAFNLLVNKTKGWKDPFVVGLDANWAAGFEAYAASKGFKSVRGDNPSPTHGKKIIDYVLVRNAASRRWYKVLKGDGSDHNMVSTGLTGKA